MRSNPNINSHGVLKLHEHKQVEVAISRAYFAKSDLFLTLPSTLSLQSIPSRRSRIAFQGCLTTCYAERERQRLSPNFRAFLFRKTSEHRSHSVHLLSRSLRHRREICQYPLCDLTSTSFVLSPPIACAYSSS